MSKEYATLDLLSQVTVPETGATADGIVILRPTGGIITRALDAGRTATQIKHWLIALAAQVC